MRKTSRVRNICNVAVLFILALSISLFGCNNNTPVEGRGNLNIIVSDQASKTVAYEPADGYPSAMSHYTVVVKDSGGETVGTSGYMALENGEGRFEVTNLITGSYTVNVSGFIQTAADEYMLIATGAETATVNASYANDLVVAIDTFDDAYTGDISVELTMPIDAIVNNTITGDLSWTLTAIDDSDVSFNGSETLTATVLVDGKYTLTITDQNVPAGRYLLTVTFDNGSPYSAIDAVIAYPGLPSTGALNLDSRKPSSYEFAVTDMIGDELKPAGDGVYSAESDSFVVTLSTALGENETPIWFVDGVATEVTDNGDGSYTLTGLDDGRRNVTMVVYDDGFKSVIGSLTFVVDVKAAVGIEEIERTPLSRPELIIDYENEVVYLTSMEEADIYYSIDGSTPSIPYPETGIDASNVDFIGNMIKAIARKDGRDDSEIREIPIPDRPVMPLLGVIDQSFPGMNDWKITGFTSGTPYELILIDPVEYASNWISIQIDGTEVYPADTLSIPSSTDIEEPLFIGIRKKATDSSFASEPVYLFLTTGSERIDESLFAYELTADGLSYEIVGMNKKYKGYTYGINGFEILYFPETHNGLGVSRVIYLNESFTLISKSIQGNKIGINVPEGFTLVCDVDDDTLQLLAENIFIIVDGGMLEGDFQYIDVSYSL